MSQPAGFMIDVPITLNISVRGVGLTEEKAKEIARDYANNLKAQPHGLYSFLQAAHHANEPHVSDASIESSSEDQCEVLYELLPKDGAEIGSGRMFAKSVPERAGTSLDGL